MKKYLNKLQSLGIEPHSLLNPTIQIHKMINHLKLFIIILYFDHYIFLNLRIMILVLQTSTAKKWYMLNYIQYINKSQQM